MLSSATLGTEECSFVQLERIGRGGALLACDKPIPVGSYVDLAICLAGGVIRTRARVLYHQQSDSGVGIGVEFVAISGDDAELLAHLAAPSPRELASARPTGQYS
jgi:hypothetical protein